MINFDYVNENKTQHNLNWPYISDHPYRKANALLNLINYQPDIDKIYLYAKDPYEAKYQYLIKMSTKILMNTMWIKSAKY